MTRGSKVFKPGDVPESNASGYPEPFREGQRKPRDMVDVDLQHVFVESL
jgi:hypothetical protein